MTLLSLGWGIFGGDLSPFLLAFAVFGCSFVQGDMIEGLWVV